MVEITRIISCSYSLLSKMKSEHVKENDVAYAFAKARKKNHCDTFKPNTNLNRYRKKNRIFHSSKFVVFKEFISC
ncbi:hypothetical protein [Nonlabens spongiae]|uniref:hypothetical protein n=1 Tax=Nonlabens spongiae TaxID=331648 RepID=UPI0012F4F3BB|nr:hypothetical protein [Nonlabens spongiae]